MNARHQVIEAELKIVRVLGLTPNIDLARAAAERAEELRAELQQLQSPQQRSSFPSRKPRK